MSLLQAAEHNGPLPRERTFYESLKNVLRGDIPLRPVVAVIAVLTGTMMTSWHTRLFSMALMDLRGVWGLGGDEASILSTVANALQLMVAPAIPMAVVIFGPRKVLLWPGLIFAAVCICIPMVQDQRSLLLLNGIAAVTLGCFVPATLTTIFRSLAPKYWLVAVAFYTARLTVSLHSGVTMADFYVENLGWQFIYWQSAVSSILLVMLVLFSIPEQKFNAEAFKGMDRIGAILMCTALTLVFAGLDQGNRLNWFDSWIIIGLIGGGIFLFGVFLLWQLVVPNPFAHPRVVAHANVIVPMTLGIFYSLVSFGSAYLIPNFLGTVGHLKGIQSGQFLWIIVAAQVVLLPASVWLIRRMEARLVLAFAVACMMVGCFMGTFITHEWVARDFLSIVFCFSLGTSFGFLAVMAISVGNGNPKEIVSVLAYVQIPRVVGPTFASAVLATLLTKREAMHAAWLSHYIDPGREIVREALAGGLSTISSVVSREAYVLAFRDAYTFCFWAGFGALLLILLMKHSPPNPMTPSGYILPATPEHTERSKP